MSTSSVRIGVGPMNVDADGYGNNTTMGNLSRVSRHLSHVLGENTVSMTVSQAMAAAYSSMDMFKTAAAKIQKKKGQKPWTKYDKVNAGAARGVKLRRGLVHLKTIDNKKVEFMPSGPKIALRLEKTMGSPYFKPFDLRFMGTLSGKMKTLDQKQFEERVVARQKVEDERRRQLVINEQAAPEPGEEYLLLHPVLRCKRILRRVNKNNLGGKSLAIGNIPPPLPQNLKKLRPFEPFNEYEKTGILFGHHKTHYLKAKQVIRPTTPDKTGITPKASHTAILDSLLDQSFTSAPDSKDQMSKIREQSTILNMQQETMMRRNTTEGLNDAQAPGAQSKEGLEPASAGSNTEALDKNLASTAQKNVESRGGSDSDATTSKEIITDSQGTDGTDGTSVATDDEGGASFTDEGPPGLEARNVAKHVQPHLQMAELEKLYLQVRSQLVTEVYKEDQEFANSLFSVGTEVIQAYRRAQVKADDFCKNVHRKSFDSQGQDQPRQNSS